MSRGTPGGKESQGSLIGGRQTKLHFLHVQQ